VIEDFSRLDLRDAAHVHANQHHARNLMAAAGLDEVRYVENYVYPARSLLKAQTGVINRGSYFFACLRDLLGMSEDEAGPRPPMGNARPTRGSRSSPSASSDI
jgi:hypothetical protein